MLKKHPDVKRIGGTIDMSDLERDPIVMFQKKYVQQYKGCADLLISFGCLFADITSYLCLLSASSFRRTWHTIWRATQCERAGCYAEYLSSPCLCTGRG